MIRLSTLPMALAALFAFSLPGQAVIEGNVTSEHPKYSAEVTLTSEGHRLPGVFYGAAGKGPHPTVVLLHGYPGNEKNLDIAQGLRDAGWNVLFFHYRGAWGAEGEFSFLNAEADVQAVISYLRVAEHAQELKIDPEHIALVGHSMGGHMAIAGILDNPDVACAVSYDGANLGLTFTGSEAVKAEWSAYGDNLFMLRGWSGAKSLAETETHTQRLNLLNRVDGIDTRPVLIVAADSVLIPIARIQMLADALDAAGGQVQYEVIKDDHGFNNHRRELLEVTRAFLDTSCR